VTFENVRQMALTMDNVGLRRPLETWASRTKKEVAHLLRHQRSKTTRVGGSRYSSFTSPHRFFYRNNLRAVPIACLFKIAQF
jgi:hypothetical protein